MNNLQIQLENAWQTICLFKTPLIFSCIIFLLSILFSSVIKSSPKDRTKKFKWEDFISVLKMGPEEQFLLLEKMKSLLHSNSIKMVGLENESLKIYPPVKPLPPGKYLEWLRNLEIYITVCRLIRQEPENFDKDKKQIFEIFRAVSKDTKITYEGIKQYFDEKVEPYLYEEGCKRLKQEVYGVYCDAK